MKPNIIIFNPDQMRADSLAHLGNPASSTPFLDELAGTEAVSFRNAYCQNPVCVPSRCSFFTGLYPHVNGHRTMQHLLHEGDSTLFSELKQAGYHVWMNDRNDLLAGQVPGLVTSHADEIFHEGYKVKPMKPVNPELRGKPGDKDFYSHFEGRLGANGDGEYYSPDDAAVDAAIERILHPVDDKPLCLFLGLMFPHPPYAVEDPYYSMIDRRKLPARAKIGENKSYMQSKLRELMQMDEYTEKDWDEMRACYLGMCRKIDDQFRRVCQALKDAGIYDNSAIFFFSDHGDYTGDYGIPEKAQNTFEDCLTNVPLLIKPPKSEAIDAGVTDSFAELIDFYATAIDYAGVDPGRDYFGKSLRPILQDRNRTLRDYVFCEGGRLPHEEQCDEYHAAAGSSGVVSENSMYWPRMTAQTDNRAHAKGTMIRDKNYKYVHRLTGEHEFYDLIEDPLEEENIYGSGHKINEIVRLRLALLDWYQETCDVVPRVYDSRMPPEFLWARVEDKCEPEWADEIKKLIYGGAGPAAVMARVADMRKGSKK